MDLFLLPMSYMRKKMKKMSLKSVRKQKIFKASLLCHKDQGNKIKNRNS